MFQFAIDSTNRLIETTILVIILKLNVNFAECVSEKHTYCYFGD